MKSSAFILFLSLISYAHASQDCNLILSDHLSASIQNLAQLRYDLDSQLAKGEMSAIPHAMLTAFDRKKAEILKYGAATGLTSASLDQNIKNRITEIQQGRTKESIERSEVEDQQKTAIQAKKIEILKLNPLIEPRTLYSICKISENEFLVAGGIAGVDHYLTSIERYDVRTGNSRIIGQLSLARRDVQLKLLPNGKVLAWGGGNDSGKKFDIVELIDPKLETVERLDAKLNGDSDAFVMPDGKILQLARSEGSFWILDLTKDETKKYSIPQLTRHGDRGVSQLTDGSVVIVGGYFRDSTRYVDQILKIDGNTFAVRMIAHLPQTLSSHAQLILANDQMIISGGEWARTKTSLELSDRVEQVDLTTGNLTTLGHLLGTRTQHTMIPLPENRLMILGGFVGSIGSEQADTVEIFDLETGTSEVVAMLNERAKAYSTVLMNQGVVVLNHYGSELSLIKFGER